MQLIRPATFLFAAGLTLSISQAQWPTGPTLNVPVADATSDQNQPLLEATPDGGVWVSWFDGIGSGWDVRVQRMDAAGQEVLPHNGVLVADRDYSSTQDYGFDTDVFGNALLAFRDDRSGSTEITAAKVNADGSLAWGVNGIALTSGAGFVAAPEIAGTPDGGAMVSWMENGTVFVQQLNGAGVAQWASPVSLVPSTGSYSVSDMHASGAGVVVSIVHQIGSFSSPRYLLAQKFDLAGNALWGATPLDIFNAGSLQFGNFPDFTPDDAGGAIFAWYSSSPNLQCFAQRVDAAGNELWIHNGVPVAINAAQIRVNPHVEFSAKENATYIGWTEQNSSQSMQGAYAQRLDQAGIRTWGATGRELVPLGSEAIFPVRIVPDGPDAASVAYWNVALGFDENVFRAAYLDSAGVNAVAPFDVASAMSGKVRPVTVRTTSQLVVSAWSDSRNDGGDIYAQATRFDGTGLGGPQALSAGFCSANPNSTGSPGSLDAYGSDVASANSITLIASDLPLGQFAMVLNSQTFGPAMQPAGSQGNLCLNVAIGRYNAPGQIMLTGGFGAGSLALDLTQTPTPMTPTMIVAGQTWNFQAWYRDLNPGQSNNFTAGASVTFN